MSSEYNQLHDYVLKGGKNVKVISKYTDSEMPDDARSLAYNTLYKILWDWSVKEAAWKMWGQGSIKGMAAEDFAQKAWMNSYIAIMAGMYTDNGIFKAWYKRTLTNVIGGHGRKRENCVQMPEGAENEIEDKNRPSTDDEMRTTCEKWLKNQLKEFSKKRPNECLENLCNEWFNAQFCQVRGEMQKYLNEMKGCYISDYLIWIFLPINITLLLQNFCTTRKTFSTPPADTAFQIVSWTAEEKKWTVKKAFPDYPLNQFWNDVKSEIGISVTNDTTSRIKKETVTNYKSIYEFLLHKNQIKSGEDKTWKRQISRMRVQLKKIHNKIFQKNKHGIPMMLILVDEFHRLKEMLSQPLSNDVDVDNSSVANDNSTN